MLRQTVVASLLGIGSLFLPLQAEEATAPLEIERVAEGVIAFLQPAEGRFNDSNAVLVFGEKAAVIVDAPMQEAAIEFIVQTVPSLLDVPVTHVVNTHWHSDHVLGNRRYLEAFPEAVVVAHENTARDIEARAMVSHLEDIDRWEAAIDEARGRLERGVQRDGSPLKEGEGPEAEARIARAVERVEQMKRAEFVAPSLLVSGSLDLDLGNLQLGLHHLPGHTEGDLVAWIETRGVLVTGDLLDDLPFGGHGSPQAAIRSLETLAEFPFRSIVPGHGSVRTGREHLQTVQRYYLALAEHAERAVAEGRTLEQAQESLDLGELKGLLATDDAASRSFDGFASATLKAAFEEASTDR